MNKKKSIFQKFSLMLAVTSIALAFTSAGFLYFRTDSTTSVDPISSSLAAAIFFFVCISFIFSVIGMADIPSFKFDSHTENKN